MKERIMQIMQSLNMNQQDFAKEINYRLAVELKKLLRACLRVHALAGAAGKDNSYVHIAFLL